MLVLVLTKFPKAHEFEKVPKQHFRPEKMNLMESSVFVAREAAPVQYQCTT